jgi:DNA repair exonuclease SbcCD ATPase subunit
MQIRKLVLDNVCQHERLELEFSPGVTGVIGPQASGKSNIIKAAQFAITGDWPGHGNKAAKVRWGQKAGSVTLWFDVNGREGKVMRCLHTSRCSLDFDGQSWRSAADVEKQLAAILGASARVLGSYVFIHQDEVNRVLFERPTERAKLFNVLFGTSNCEKLREDLGKELQTWVPVSLSADQATIDARLAEAEKELAAANKALAESQPVLAEDLTAAQRELVTAEAHHKAYTDPSTGYDATLKFIQQTDARLATLKATDTRLAAAAGESETQLQALTEKIGRLQNVSEHNQRAITNNTRRASLLSRIQDLKSSLTGLVKPAEVPDQDAKFVEIERLLAPAEEELRKAREFVQGFTAGECLSCHTTKIIDRQGQEVDIAATAAAHRAKLEKSGPQVAMMRQAVTNYREQRQAYLRAAESYQRMVDNAAQQIADAEKLLEACPEMTLLDSSALDAAAAERVKAQGNYSRSKAELEEARREAATLAAQRNNATENSKRLIALLPLADLQKLRTAAYALQERHQQRATFEAKVMVLQGSVNELKARREAIISMSAKAVAVEKYRELCSQAQGVLHRDNYPATVARQHFRMINAGWNPILQLMDVRYGVQIADDASIKVRFPEQETVIEDLSGGEKCCASVSFQLQVNRQFARDVGFLCLDEPTYGLDAEHLDRMLDLLQHVQQYADSAGMQILIVTHEQRLKDGFKKVIELQKVL